MIDNGSCQTKPAILRARFDDLESLAATVRCEVTQLAPGGVAEVVRLELASGYLETLRSTFDLIARGTRPAGLVTFVTTGRGLPGLALNGRSGRSDPLWAYGPGAEIYGAFPRRSEVTLIAVADSRFGASDCGDRGLGGRCRELRSPPRLRRAVSDIVEAAFDLARLQPAALHDPRRRMLIENDLVERLSLALQVDEASPGRRRGPVSAPSQLVLRAVDEQLETRRGERLSVTELSTVCGVSERTLRNVFLHAHGVSPMEYVRLRRLKAVRRMLVRADAEGTTVSEAALTWGFWHPGAFSVLYRRTFGEKPSETLRRRH
jgi:AraC-like DNA-binding protein